MSDEGYAARVYVWGSGGGREYNSGEEDIIGVWSDIGSSGDGRECRGREGDVSGVRDDLGMSDNGEECRGG